MLNRLDEAQPLAAEAGARLRELTGEAAGAFMLSHVAHLAGDDEQAARELREYCDLLQERGLRFQLSSFAPMLGRLLCLLGRHDEAVPLVRLARELGDEQDALTQILCRQVQALVDAAHGDHSNAGALAREAVAIAQTTDGLNWQGDALADLAQVLLAGGRIDEAATVVEQALERYEGKKNFALAARLRSGIVDRVQAAASARDR